MTSQKPNEKTYDYRFRIIQERFNELSKKYDKELNGWILVIDYFNIGRLGQCRYSRKEVGISHYYLLSTETDKIDDYLDTINHEVAHILTRGHSHDKVWKAKCIELGGNGKTCGNVSLKEFCKYKYGCDKGCIYRRNSKNNKFEKEIYLCNKHSLSITLKEKRESILPKIKKNKPKKKYPYKWRLECMNTDCDYKYKKYKKRNKKLLEMNCPNCKTDTLYYADI